mgnify:CR=1 FL=1
MNREFMSETVHIFLSNKRCIRMCHNIKNNSHEFVFLRAGSKSVNYILYYTLIYRKIRTLHIEVHLGFLSHRREIRTLHTKNPREFFVIHGVELEFACQKF